jgi:hypothetical protein
MPSPVIGYQSRPAPLANPEFDYHFDAELARRLRRRFLWYCGLTIAISTAVLLPGMISGQPVVQAGFDGQSIQPPASVRNIYYLTSAISLLIYAVAFVYVVTRKIRRERLLRLALWVYVLASIPGLIGLRLILHIAFPPGVADQIVDQEIGRRSAATQSEPALEAFSTGFRAGYRTTAPDTQPGAATQPRQMTPAQSQRLRSLMTVLTHPAFVFCMTVPFVMLFHQRQHAAPKIESA